MAKRISSIVETPVIDETPVVETPVVETPETIETPVTETPANEAAIVEKFKPFELLVSTPDDNGQCRVIVKRGRLVHTAFVFDTTNCATFVIANGEKDAKLLRFYASEYRSNKDNYLKLSTAVSNVYVKNVVSQMLSIHFDCIPF